MTYSRTFITKTLSVLVITCAVAAFYAAPVAAQTATSLNCNGCVKSKQIKNGKVKGKDLKDETVTGSKIADGTVGNADLGANAVTSGKIATGAVGASEIATGAVTSSKLSSGAKPGGADTAAAALFGDVALTAADAIIASVTITAPAAGMVIVTASGYFDFNAVNGDARCSLTTGSSLNFLILTRATGSSGVHRYVPLARTRGFTVPGAGSVAYNLVCDEVSGNVEIADVTMTAIYVPQKY